MLFFRRSLDSLACRFRMRLVINRFVGRVVDVAFLVRDSRDFDGVRRGSRRRSEVWRPCFCFGRRQWPWLRNRPLVPGEFR